MLKIMVGLFFFWSYALEREFCHDWMINLKQDEKRKGRTKHKAKLGNVYVQV